MAGMSEQDGLTEARVHDLYRLLLGRPPESDDTVRAFTSYYPDIGSGRKAVFTSDEFRRFYASVTGMRPVAEQSASAALAEGFLRRAGGTASVIEAPSREEIRRGMGAMLRALDGGPDLALILGAPDLNLGDYVPADERHIAILHVAEGFPHFVPSVSRGGEAPVFRIYMDSESLLGFLRGLDIRVGLALLLGSPAGPALLEGLRGRLAPKAIIGVGPGKSDFAAETCLASLHAWHGQEPLPEWFGLRLFYAGGWHLPVAYTPEAAGDRPNAEEFPALALACIARNEQDSIGHMLRSALPVASFVAVLDTGSSDDTLEQARQTLSASGKPFVCGRQELERFDDMRNAALAMVPDWVEFVLMLDADEALASEDHRGLLELLRTADKDAYALPRYNYLGMDMHGPVTPYPDRQVRLLRHRPGHCARYSGAVHETVRGVEVGVLPLDARALGLSRGGPHIHHLVRRFRTPEQEARKQAHYRDLAARLGTG
jgi:hypothetical protein